MVSYLPLFAAVAASCDALADAEPGAPRFVLLDDAFAKVSEDNHAKLFGLLVELDLDFIATSERLWGTHATVPELAITEVLRDASLGVIVLEHSRWDGHERTMADIDCTSDRRRWPRSCSATSSARSGRSTGRSWACSPGRSSPSSRPTTSPPASALRATPLDAAVVGRAAGEPAAVGQPHGRRRRSATRRASPTTTGAGAATSSPGPARRCTTSSKACSAGSTRCATSRRAGMRALRDALRGTRRRSTPSVPSPSASPTSCVPCSTRTGRSPSEITQFFAAINQWQSRYDLTPEEFTFFAEVLVGYVAERLDEIERTARPIGRQLVALGAARAGDRRAGRARARQRGSRQAGLQDAVTVSHTPGTTVADWEHLAGWFVAPTRPAVADRAPAPRRRGGDPHADAEPDPAVARRARRLVAACRLPAAGDDLRTRSPSADDGGAARPSAAFGLHPASHYGVARRRRRRPGEHRRRRGGRRRAPRCRCRSASAATRPTVAGRRRWPTAASPSGRCCVATRARARRAADGSTPSCSPRPTLDGATLSTPALARLQQLVGRTLQQLPVSGPGHARTDGASAVHAVERAAGHATPSSPRRRATLAASRDLARPMRRRPPMADDPQAAVERRVAARHLLQHPLTCAEHDPDEFRLIRRHEGELDRWFTQRLGYRLHVDTDTARLFKSGTVPERRPLRTTTRRAVHPPGVRARSRWCWRPPSPGRPSISLRDLVDDVRSAAAEADVTLAGRRHRATCARHRAALDDRPRPGRPSCTPTSTRTPPTASADAVLKLRPDRIALVPAARRRSVSRTPTRCSPRPSGGRRPASGCAAGSSRTRCSTATTSPRSSGASCAAASARRSGCSTRCSGCASRRGPRASRRSTPTATSPTRRSPTGGTVGHCALLVLEHVDGEQRFRGLSCVDVVTELADRYRRRWSNELVAAPERLTRDVVDLLVGMRLAVTRRRRRSGCCRRPPASSPSTRSTPSRGRRASSGDRPPVAHRRRARRCVGPGAGAARAVRGRPPRPAVRAAPDVGGPARGWPRSLGRPARSTVDLAALERGLVALGVGDDLPDALAALGHPVSSEPAERRAARLAAREARTTRHGPLRLELAGGLGAGVDRGGDPIGRAERPRARRSGADDPRRSSPTATPVSRVDLAARLFGDAHALDTGTRLEAATARALRHRLGPDPPAEVWTQAGVTLDLVSAPALTWNLPGELAATRHRARCPAAPQPARPARLPRDRAAGRRRARRREPESRRGRRPDAVAADRRVDQRQPVRRRAPPARPTPRRRLPRALPRRLRRRRPRHLRADGSARPTTVADGRHATTSKRSPPPTRPA